MRRPALQRKVEKILNGFGMWRSFVVRKRTGGAATRATPRVPSTRQQQQLLPPMVGGRQNTRGLAGTAAPPPEEDLVKTSLYDLHKGTYLDWKGFWPDRTGPDRLKVRPLFHERPPSLSQRSLLVFVLRCVALHCVALHCVALCAVQNWAARWSHSLDTHFPFNTVDPMGA